MYRCGVCGAVSQPRQPRRTHVVEREVPRDDGHGFRREIAREVPVCPECAKELEAGASLRTLVLRNYPPTVVEETAPALTVPHRRSEPAPAVNRPVEVGRTVRR